MDRLQVFNKLADHPWYGPKILELRPAAKALIEACLQEWKDLDRSQFAAEVNKITKVDRTTLLIIEILNVINVAEQFSSKEQH